MSKKNFTPKRDKDGKFKETGKKNTTIQKKTTAKKSSKKAASSLLKPKPPKRKVEAVLPPPIVVEKTLSTKTKETFVDMKEQTHNTVQKVWDKYVDRTSNKVEETFPCPDDNAECYMGISYQIVSNEKHRIKLKIWNETTGSWNDFSLNADPSLSDAQRQEDIRDVLLSAVRESRKPHSARGDIPAAHASH